MEEKKLSIPFLAFSMVLFLCGCKYESPKPELHGRFLSFQKCDGIYFAALENCSNLEQIYLSDYNECLTGSAKTFSENTTPCISPPHNSLPPKYNEIFLKYAECMLNTMKEREAKDARDEKCLKTFLSNMTEVNECIIKAQSDRSKCAGEWITF